MSADLARDIQLVNRRLHQIAQEAKRNLDDNKYISPEAARFMRLVGWAAAAAAAAGAVAATALGAGPLLAIGAVAIGGAAGVTGQVVDRVAKEKAVIRQESADQLKEQQSLKNDLRAIYAVAMGKPQGVGATFTPSADLHQYAQDRLQQQQRQKIAAEQAQDVSEGVTYEQMKKSEFKLS